MQEKTILTELKDKWWKQKRGGGVCPQIKVTPLAIQQKAHSVGGIFLILVRAMKNLLIAIYQTFFQIGGLIIAISVAVVELILEANKIAKQKSVIKNYKRTHTHRHSSQTILESYSNRIN